MVECREGNTVSANFPASTAIFSHLEPAQAPTQEHVIFDVELLLSFRMRSVTESHTEAGTALRTSLNKLSRSRVPLMGSWASHRCELTLALAIGHQFCITFLLCNSMLIKLAPNAALVKTGDHWLALVSIGAQVLQACFVRKPCTSTVAKSCQILTAWVRVFKLQQQIHLCVTTVQI